MLEYIPKGSEIYNGTTLIGIVKTDIKSGYIMQPQDFEPPLPVGAVISDLIFKFEGKIVYRHPYFVDNA